MCSANDTENLPPRCKKSVCFGSVQVREHPVILGDNPSCTSGPPLTISWDHFSSFSLTVEEWESGRCLLRRTPDEMRVPASVRTEWILDARYSPLQVHTAVQTVEGERRRRRSSLEKSPIQDRADIMAESLRRKLGRAVGRGRKPGNGESIFLQRSNGRRPGGSETFLSRY